MPVSERTRGSANRASAARQKSCATAPDAEMTRPATTSRIVANATVETTAKKMSPLALPVGDGAGRELADRAAARPALGRPVLLEVVARLERLRPERLGEAGEDGLAALFRAP
jgi:hypothetical protein